MDAWKAEMDASWGRFLATMKNGGQTSGPAWSEAYRLGDHTFFDHSSPSVELVGYVLGARLPPGSRVLDLGCGTGADAVFLASLNYETFGADFSAEALGLTQKRAREQGVVVNLRECNALNTPFDDGFLI
jgi:2-polyprenyl-3-methyl-5-hydroxy-6-metoxy-1,4-benzoquinol methylase